MNRRSFLRSLPSHAVVAGAYGALACARAATEVAIRRDRRERLMLAIERLSNCNPRPFRAGSVLKADQLNDLASGNVALAMAMLEILNDSEHP